MLKYTTRIGAALFLAIPASLSAQEAMTEDVTPEAADVCVATVAEPIEIGTINAVAATFDAPFGAIVGIEAPEGTGLVLADAPENAELIDVADESADIELQAANSEIDNAAIFWVDAATATVGTHEIKLWNEAESYCIAEVTVIDVVEATDETLETDEMDMEMKTDDMDASDEDTSDEESSDY